MNERKLVMVNAATLAIMLTANFLCSSKMLFGTSVADISYKYDTLFTPAGYAFLIWSVIFVMLIAFVIFQWHLLRQNQPLKLRAAGGWFALSNVTNVLWLVCWINEQLALSVVVILMLLLCLIKLTINLKLELDDEPVRNIFFVWWPIAVYLGWIMVATIACVAAWLTSIGWSGGFLSEDLWAVTMVIVATLLYLYLLKKRNLRETAGVGIWAFIAIAVRQWTAHFNIAATGLACGVILFFAVSWHAWQNRQYNIGEKLKRGEWK